MAKLARMTRKRLGELLLEESLVTEEQLTSALAIQQHTGDMLGEVFVTQGMVKEEDVARVIARQYGLPYFNPHQYEINPDVKTIFPEAALNRYHFVPLDLFADSLLIVIAGLLQPETVREIERISAKRIHLLVGTVSAVREVLSGFFHGDDSDMSELGSLLLGEKDTNGEV